MNLSQSTTRKRGPAPGTTVGRKRKANDELSENPHTVKGRRRLEAIKAKGEIFAEFERTKKNENQALNRAKKKELKTRPEWQNATEPEKERLECEFKRQFLENRYLNGEGVQWFLERHDFNNIDDGDWEDVKDDATLEATEIKDDKNYYLREYDEIQTIKEIATKNGIESRVLMTTIEAMRPLFSDELKQHFPHTIRPTVRHARKDDKIVFYKKQSKFPVYIVRTGYHRRLQAILHRRLALLIAFSKNPLNAMIYGVWYNHWIQVAKRLMEKSMQTKPNERPKEPPHNYFSTKEIQLYKAFISANSSEWYELPGPAEWWPNNYQYPKYGWQPCDDEKMIPGYRLAVQYLSEFSPNDEIPKDFRFLLWNLEEFCLLYPGIGNIAS